MSTVFPAAAQPEQGHPSACACRACADALVAAIRKPLVEPVPRPDPALDRRRRR